VSVGHYCSTCDQWRHVEDMKVEVRMESYNVQGKRLVVVWTRVRICPCGADVSDFVFDNDALQRAYLAAGWDSKGMRWSW